MEKDIAGLKCILKFSFDWEQVTHQELPWKQFSSQGRDANTAPEELPTLASARDGVLLIPHVESIAFCIEYLHIYTVSLLGLEV